MKTDGLIDFLGWACLTFMWLEANRLFFSAIAEKMRQKSIEEYNEFIRRLTIEVNEMTMRAKMRVKMRAKMNDFKIIYIHTMSDNKLVKSMLEAATITGLVTGIGWIGKKKKTIKENFTADPSANIMNYVKFTAVMAGSIALKKYLEDQKILPDNL